MTPSHTLRSAAAALLVSLGTAAATLAAGIVGSGTPASCTDAAIGTALTGGGVVTFNCGGGPLTITITTTKTITSDTTIDGGGTITVSGGNTVRLFLVNSGVTLTLQNLTVANGFAGSSSPGSTIHGGGIANSGTLIASNCTFSGNHAAIALPASVSLTSVAEGGAIFGGTVTVTNCTFSANAASITGGANAPLNLAGGGAIAADQVAIFTSTFSGNSASASTGHAFAYGGAVIAGGINVAHSTFSGNSSVGGEVGGASGAVDCGDGAITTSTFSGNSTATIGGGPGSSAQGGAVDYRGPSTLTVADSTFFNNGASATSGTGQALGGAINNVGQGGALIIANSTFSANSTSGVGGSFGDAVVGPATLSNTILANSAAAGHCSGTITDAGHNIQFNPNSGCVGTGVDPMLDPSGLQSNGGPTQTIALLAGSPAINTGNDSVCAAAPVNGVDQRGVTRSTATDPHCDIGAYEFACGNGSVDPGEQCDLGVLNGNSTSCCTTACAFRTAGQACRPIAGACDSAEACTGSSAACPTDVKLGTATVCRAAVGVCDKAEVCDGVSNDCPADSLLSSTTVCRAAAGVCDVAENCTGSGPSCPSDAKLDSTHTCRAAAGACDIAEVCDGVNNDCPPDISLCPTGSPTRSATVTATPTTTPSPTRTATATPTLVTVTGRVGYHGSGVPVASAAMQLNGTTAQQTTSLADGSYAFAASGGGGSTLLAAKLGDFQGAITALDAVFALQAAVGLRTLDAAQFVAADSNGSGSLTAIDAVFILQLRVGLISQLPVAAHCGSDWMFRFVPTPASDQQVVNPQMTSTTCQAGGVSWQPLTTSASGQDFEGILLGDANASWQPPAGGGAAADFNLRPIVHIGRWRRSANGATMAVAVESTLPFNALDLDLAYDATQVHPRAVLPAPRAAMALVQFNNTVPSQLAVAFASSEPLSGRRRRVLRIDFDVLGGADPLPAVSHVHATLDDQPTRVMLPALAP